MFDAVNAEFGRQLNRIFADIDPAATPIAAGIRDQVDGGGMVGIVEALVNAVAALETRLAENHPSQ